MAKKHWITRMKEENQALKKEVVRLKSLIPEEEPVSDTPEREKRPKARGGSCYGLNGWDITFYEDSSHLEQSDIKVYPEKGYNYKIEKWKKDGDDIYLEIHSLSPTAVCKWPGQLWDLSLRSNDFTGPDDPELTSP